MVTIVTSPNCQPCRLSKRRLNELGVEFVERNVATDPEAVELARSLGHNASPVIILENGESWSGFRPDRIDALAA